MTKCQQVVELKSYINDKQLLEERTMEIEKNKALILNTISRLHEMKKLDNDSSLINNKIQDLFNQQAIDENVIFETLNKKHNIENKIDKLPQPYKNILFLKYIRGDSIKDICSKMNCSSKRFYELHKYGIDLYCKIDLSDK